MEPLLERLLTSFGGSEANFLELCFRRFPYGNFHTEATSKKFRSPSGNFRPNHPRISEKSLHEHFQSGGWLEDCLKHSAGEPLSSRWGCTLALALAPVRACSREPTSVDDLMCSMTDGISEEDKRATTTVKVEIKSKLIPKQL